VIKTNHCAAASQEERHEPPSRRRLIFLLAIALSLADLLVLDVAHDVRVWAHLPKISQWNWFGKSISIAFSCLLLACSPWLRQNVGLRWRQAPGSIRLSLGCFVTFLACAIGIGFQNPSIPFSADTLMYQFFMPGIAEELMDRGILLALFERSFGQSPMSCRLRFGYAALITSLIFGFGHGVSVDDGRLAFSFLQFSIPTLIAAALALVRTRSGSLLWPILCHGTWNGPIFLVRMLQ